MTAALPRSLTDGVSEAETEVDEFTYIDHYGASALEGVCSVPESVVEEAIRQQEAWGSLGNIHGGDFEREFFRGFVDFRETCSSFHDKMRDLARNGPLYFY